jgi:RNAse (barnase) inhibitor barstar
MMVDHWPKEINLDAATWRDRDDFYDALLPALGAPSWHGRNLDALNDTLGGNDINEVRLPFHIRITNTVRVPSELLSYLKRFAELVDDLRTREHRELRLTLD